MTWSEVAKRLALAALVVGAPAAGLADNTPIVIKFSHVVAQETPKGLAALKFGQPFARLPAVVRRHFGHRGTFFGEAFADRHLPLLPRFDGVLLLGLLHHLDDRDADALLALVARALAPNGRVVTLDTCSDPRHTPLARWISQHDRGRHVRTGEAFVALAERRFGRVEAELAGEDLPLGVGLWRMLLADPRPPQATHGSA